MPKIEKLVIAFAGIVLLTLATAVTLLPLRRNSSLVTRDRVTKAAEMSKVFWMRKSSWPTNLDQLVRSGFLKSGDTNDGWARPLLYRPYKTSVMCGSVLSYGSDGQPGGVGQAADIEGTFR